MRRGVLIHPDIVPPELETRDEKLLWRTEFESRLRLHDDGHKHSIRRYVEQLPPVPPPLGEYTTVVRDPPLMAAAWKIADVDFVPPCLVGRVGNPAWCLSRT